jgi:sugar O-acyltransferase (sialic acid O-acetyltransferase NeuD family)
MIERKILIIGTGQHARMLVELIEEQGKYLIAGFISKNQNRGVKILGYPILCVEKNLKNFLKKNRDIKFYACGVGDNSGGMLGREKIIKFYDNLLFAPKIISPRSYISKYSKIGKGSIIEAYAKVMNGATIGKHCMIESFTAVNHDQKIKSNVFIGNNCALAGKSVGKNTIIGDGSSVGYKVSIGSNCIINQGTVVTNNIKNNRIVFGNPCKVLKNNNKFVNAIKKKKN